MIIKLESENEWREPSDKYDLTLRGLDEFYEYIIGSRSYCNRFEVNSHNEVVIYHDKRIPDILIPYHAIRYELLNSKREIIKNCSFMDLISMINEQYGGVAKIKISRLVIGELILEIISGDSVAEVYIIREVK